jgi:cytochrome d ubiquinol oxidase subunit I
MDVLLLSRVQFALSIGIHFLFPVTTLGLAFYIVVSEGLFLKTGREWYRRVSALGVKILAFIFAMGVATGIIMPFAFGTNWANFVSFANAVFGIHLTVEVIVAFMLESVFLGVLLFGRKRVSKGLYFVSALMVFLGSHFSAFLILSANSWLQTPFHSLETLMSGIPRAEIDGFHLVTLADGGGRLVMDDVAKVIFNPSAPIRFFHTVTACWLCGAVVMAAACGWHWRKHPQAAAARQGFVLAVAIGIVTAIAQPLLGHQHIMTVLRWQPTKNAAMEGIFKTQRGAPLYALGWVDETARKTYALGMPYALSFLESWDINGEVQGLDDILALGKTQQSASPGGSILAESPPVQPVFQAFHLMVMAGVLMIGGMALALVTIIRKKSLSRLTGMVLMALVPLPYVAVEAGWIGAEIGRQPWIIYGLQKTADGVSLLPVEYVGFSLVVLGLVWIALGVLLVKFLPRIIREGLERELAGTTVGGDNYGSEGEGHGV